MSTNDNAPNLVGVTTGYGENADGLFRKHTQNISQAFLDNIKDVRNETSGKPAGEFMRVASIPTVVVEKWLREGFDVFDPNVNGKDILKRLHAENLDAFITTDKSI